MKDKSITWNRLEAAFVELMDHVTRGYTGGDPAVRVWADIGVSTTRADELVWMWEQLKLKQIVKDHQCTVCRDTCTVYRTLDDWAMIDTEEQAFFNELNGAVPNFPVAVCESCWPHGDDL